MVCVKLILCVCSLRRVKKRRNSSLVCDQNNTMSSMYLRHKSGLTVSCARKFSSTSAITRVASAGASLVPMARPYVCLKKCPSKVNTLLYRTYLSKSNKNTKREWCLNGQVKVVIARSCVMLVYKVFTLTSCTVSHNRHATYASYINLHYHTYPLIYVP